ncbi:ribonuclease HII [Candidatus Woesearchaeota archaeon]|nr:ribonuclease HII [Candidatus Woesearchaeota archaeon]
MVKILGIDEAGRGPVIGPMVMAGVLIGDDDEKKLKAIGAKDSKLLSPSARELLYDKILAIVKNYEIVILTPQDIDKAVNDPGVNLNGLELRTSAVIINHLKPDKAILDCPSNQPKAYVTQLKQHLSHTCDIVAEHKADVNYVVVSAASILAKVTRDREIKKIKELYGEIGSGYPADPLTQEFLRKNYKTYPALFRKSWQSYKNVLDKKSQRGIEDF